MTSEDPLESFLTSKSFAVVGASADRSKYGNRVLRALVSFRATRPDVKLAAVNPKAESIEGVPTFADLSSIEFDVEAVSIITPPVVTERVIAEALEIGIRQFWIQPGAESENAIAKAEEMGANVIHGGPCILVRLGYRGE